MSKKWFDVLMMGIPLVFRLVFKLIDRQRAKRREAKKNGTDDKTERLASGDKTGGGKGVEP